MIRAPSAQPDAWRFVTTSPNSDRRDGQVVERVPRLTEHPAQGVERFDVVVGALDVAQLRRQRPNRPRPEAVHTEALAGALPKAVEVAGPRHADDRQVEALVADQAGQRGEDLLEGKVPGGPEEDEGVRALVATGSGRAGRAGRHHDVKVESS